MKTKYIVTALSCTLAFSALGQTPEADPLDVLEQNPPSNQEEVVPPSMPEFTEIPAPEVAAEEAVPNSVQNQESAKPVDVGAPVESMMRDQVPAPQKNAKKKRASVAQKNLEPGEPDLAKEDYFHRLYLKYNQNPTPVETWEAVSGNRRSEVYKIQAGDTLWDLSKTLFADSQYWPKVWSLNSQLISNPHEINPSMQIHFYPGTASDVPTLSLANKVHDSSNVDAGVTGKVTQESGKIIAGKSKSPILQSLPDSLPQYRFKSLEQPPRDEFVTGETRQVKTELVVTRFIANRPAAGVGRLLELDDREGFFNVATEGMPVIVELESGQGVGSYRIIKTREKIFNDLSDSGKPAYVIEVVGELEVIEAVSVKKNTYRGIVRKAFSAIEMGSILDQKVIEKVELDDKGGRTQVQGKIISLDLGVGRSMVANSDFIHLQVQSGSLQIGDVVEIWGAHAKHRESERERKLAIAQVVSADAGLATAYILQADEKIQVGDKVR